jgi:hypothetical protein
MKKEFSFVFLRSTQRGPLETGGQSSVTKVTARDEQANAVLRGKNEMRPYAELFSSENNPRLVKLMLKFLSLHPSMAEELVALRFSPHSDLTLPQGKILVIDHFRPTLSPNSLPPPPPFIFAHGHRLYRS